MPKFNEWLFGTKDKTKKETLLSPEQEQLMQLISEGLESGTGPFADIFGKFNEEGFNKGVSEPALKNFKENVLPQLNEQFIAGGQFGGSGHRRATNKAGVDLQSRLAELMYGAQNQQAQNRQQGINSLLGKQSHENVIQGGNEGALSGFIKGVGGGIGNAVGTSTAGLFGKTPGSAQGAPSLATQSAQAAIAG